MRSHTLYALFSQGKSVIERVSRGAHRLVELPPISNPEPDSYDIWLLSRHFDFHGAKLSEPIRLIVKREGAKPSVKVGAFIEPFIQAKQPPWAALRKRLKKKIPFPHHSMMSSLAWMNFVRHGRGRFIRQTGPDHLGRPCPWARGESQVLGATRPLRWEFRCIETHFLFDRRDMKLYIFRCLCKDIIFPFTR